MSEQGESKEETNYNCDYARLCRDKNCFLQKRRLRGLLCAASLVWVLLSKASLFNHWDQITADSSIE